MHAKISMASMIVALNAAIETLQAEDTFENCRGVCIEARALMSAADEEVLFTRTVEEQWRSQAETALQNAIEALTNSDHQAKSAHMTDLVALRLRNIQEMTLERVEQRLAAIA